MNEIMMSETRTIDMWPYTGPDNMEDQYYRKTGSWVETNEEVYYNQLGAVPPIRMIGSAFMVGEAFDFNTYAVFMRVEGRYFGKIAPLHTFNPSIYRNEILKQFDIKVSKENDD